MSVPLSASSELRRHVVDRRSLYAGLFLSAAVCVQVIAGTVCAMRVVVPAAAMVAMVVRASLCLCLCLCLPRLSCAGMLSTGAH